MKQVLRKITALFMATLMLASTVSWTIEKHYCSGFLMDIALFHEAESCCGNSSEPDQDPTLPSMDGDSCCSNEVVSIKGLESLKFPDRDQVVSLPFISVLPGYGPMYYMVPEGELLLTSKSYLPPLLVRDIHILDQVFII